MKRLWETILVLLTMVLWLPLLLTVALTVLVTMGRPVWFRQERAGKGGRPSFSTPTMAMLSLPRRTM